MEDTLAQQRKSRPAIPHTLDQPQFVDLSLNDPIAFGPDAARKQCRFIAFNPQHKALKFRDLTGNGLNKRVDTISDKLLEVDKIHRAIEIALTVDDASQDRLKETILLRILGLSDKE